MTILMFHDTLNVGGIETLLVRIAQWLNAHGHKIIVIVKADGALHDSLARHAQIIVLGDSVRAYDPRFVQERCRSVVGENIDAVCSFGPTSCIVALGFVLSTGYTGPFWTGVYHPRAYFMSRKWGPALAAYAELISKVLPKQSIGFMNEDCRRQHSAALSQSFASSGIVPLPIKLGQYTRVRHNPERNVFVSVGRLTDFKTYNLYMMDLVFEAIRTGARVRWEVYGEGPLREAMEKKIAQRSLGSAVQLKGVLEYAEMPRVLSRAYGFVGMGTSVIEAAAAGVPSIVAIENGNNATHGFFHDIPLYNCGESIAGHPTFTVQEKMLELLSAEPSAYAEMSVASRSRALSYDEEVIMPQMLRAFLDAPRLELQARRLALSLTRKYYAIERYYFRPRRFLGELRRRFCGSF